MDLTTTITTSPNPTPNQSADSENDTPPHVQPIKSLPFSNGELKKLNSYHHRHRHRQPQPAVVVSYKECLKNHAASIGGHAVDGCGEFMPCSTANPTSPTSLKCAACGCHRNFHRRQPDEYCAPTLIATTATGTTHFLDFQRHPPAPPPSGRFSSSPSPPPPPPPPQTSSYARPNMLLALSTVAQDDLQPTNHHHHHYNPVATPRTPTALKGETANSSGRKRFRTRFTHDQKEKMHSFAEKLCWKMQKTDEAIIEEFCNEIGVARGVLKVWMHNNKHASAKKDISHGSNININSNSNNGVHENGRVISFQNNYYNDDDQNKNNDAVHDLHVSANGSSSSS